MFNGKMNLIKPFCRSWLKNGNTNRQIANLPENQYYNELFEALDTGVRFGWELVPFAATT